MDWLPWIYDNNNRNLIFFINVLPGITNEISPVSFVYLHFCEHYFRRVLTGEIFTVWVKKIEKKKFLINS